MTDLSFWHQPPPSLNPSRISRARERQAALTKPPGSLGRLEELAVTLCGQQDTDTPGVDRSHISIFAADHGVCAEGISAFPQQVTGQMVANFAHGGAAISVLARHLGARLEVVNLGTVEPMPELPGVLVQRIGPGTANLALHPAMTNAEVRQALEAGDQAAQRAANNDAQLFIGGDMGIGNTTSAAAVACALLAETPSVIVGPGTGLDAAGVQHKIRVVAKALQRHGDNRSPLAVLASLGGFEIAALTGAMLGCAQRRIPMLVDGFIVSVAALVAVLQQPELAPWLHFAHRSGEPGHGRILQALAAQPLLDLNMRLGEASGAAIALPLLRQACALHNQMASFADAGVDSGNSDEQ